MISHKDLILRRFFMKDKNLHVLFKAFKLKEDKNCNKIDLNNGFDVILKINVLSDLFMVYFYEKN